MVVCVMSKPSGSLMEVARRCEVSLSTVSRVLNNAQQGRFSVSPAVRAKILKVARELNYRPNIAGRNLSGSKTRLVAVLGLRDFWSDQVGPTEEAVGAMAQKIHRSEYGICMQFMMPGQGAYDPLPLRVDGVVAVSPSKLEDLARLEQSGIPYISIGGVAGPNGIEVLADDADGTRQALEHLVGLGHRQIAYLDNPSVVACHLSVFSRRQAFAEAASEMNFQIAQADLPQLAPGLPWDSYYEPFLRQAVIKGRATAVLAYSHFGALSLLRKAHDLGLSVPGDFSLVCFNNEPVLTVSVPSITAIDVPSVSMGHAAAELLLAAMEATTPPTTRKLMLRESLVVRESTKAPRSCV